MESLRELLNNLFVSIRRGLTLVTNALSHWFSRVGRVEHLPIGSRHAADFLSELLDDSDDDKDILGPNHNQDQPILELMEDSDEQSSDD